MHSFTKLSLQSGHRYAGKVVKKVLRNHFLLISFLQSCQEHVKKDPNADDYRINWSVCMAGHGQDFGSTAEEFRTSTMR